jgi:hypothetical protein
MLADGSRTLMSIVGVETSVSMFGVAHDYGEQVGAIDITGKLTVVNCDVTGDFVSNTMTSMGNTQIGDHENDTLIIKGRYAAQYLMVDADGDNKNLLNLSFPMGSTEHNTITFPSETGEVLTTVSKYSELEAVGDVSLGRLVAGFGSAEVSSFASSGAASMNGGTSLGDDGSDPLAFAGFVSSGYLMFDTDYNNEDGLQVLWHIHTSKHRDS